MPGLAAAATVVRKPVDPQRRSPKALPDAISRVAWVTSEEFSRYVADDVSAVARSRVRALQRGEVLARYRERIGVGVVQHHVAIRHGEPEWRRHWAPAPARPPGFTLFV